MMQSRLLSMMRRPKASLLESSSSVCLRSVTSTPKPMAPPSEGLGANQISWTRLRSPCPISYSKCTDSPRRDFSMKGRTLGQPSSALLPTNSLSSRPMARKAAPRDSRKTPSRSIRQAMTGSLSSSMSRRRHLAANSSRLPSDGAFSGTCIVGVSVATFPKWSLREMSFDSRRFRTSQAWPSAPRLNLTLASKREAGRGGARSGRSNESKPRHPTRNSTGKDSPSVELRAAMKATPRETRSSGWTESRKSPGIGAESPRRRSPDGLTKSGTPSSSRRRIPSALHSSRASGVGRVRFEIT